MTDPRDMPLRASAICCLALALVLGASDAEATAYAGAAQGNAKAPFRSGVLVAGPVRTDEEIVLCRKEEIGRARGEVGPEIEASAEPVKLRSAPRRLSQKECDAQARKWNFWSEENEARGCFVNAFVRREGVIADLATGLLWGAGSSKEYSYAEAAAYVERTNARKWKGYSDWRLPTAEELYSIFESVESAIEQRHLDERLFVTGNSWWSADPAEASGHHMGVSLTGSCDPFEDAARPRSVFLVRSMTRKEWAQARREYEPPRPREP